VLFAFFVARGISQSLNSETFDYEKIFRDIEREKIKKWMIRAFGTAVALGVAFGFRLLAKKLSQENAAHELRTYVFERLSSSKTAYPAKDCERLLSHDCTVVSKMGAPRVEQIEAIISLSCAVCFAFALNWQVTVFACLLAILSASWILIVNHNACDATPVKYDLSKAAEDYISESAANRHTLLRLRKGKDFENRLQSLFGDVINNAFSFKAISVLQPQIFGAVAPLFLAPLAWIVATYKEEKNDIFAALFILTFVCFTNSMANLNDIQDCSREHVHGSVEALYEVSKIEPTTEMKGDLCELREVWLRDQNDPQ